MKTSMPWPKNSVVLTLLACLLPLLNAGCNKCIKLDCQGMPAAALTPPGLRAMGGGNTVHVEAKALDISVTRDVKICAGYELLSKGTTVEGTALIVTVNGKQALTVDFQNEGGLKTASKNVDAMLVPGKNEVAVFTITYNASLGGQTVQSRAALVILADGGKIVDECYPMPKAGYQPVSQSWTLATSGSGGGGGGGPEECVACHLSQLQARWVVGLNPAPMRLNALDARAAVEAVAAEVKPLMLEGGQVLRYSAGGNFAVVTGIDPRKVAGARARPSIRYVEQDIPVHTLEVGGPRLEPIFSSANRRVAAVPAGGGPSDPNFTKQAYLPDINAPAAWAAGHKSTSVSVAVVDTGAAYDLVDLQGQVTRGQDFACKHGDQICDGNGHGTHVSGTILAKTDNAVGVAGVAWDGKVLVNKALDDGGQGNFSDICDAVRDAIDHGAKVVSLSIGALINKNQVPQYVTETAQYALDKGVVLVCAAGNDGADNDGDVRNYPSSLEFPNVIGVLATNTGARTKASFSNFGPGHVHIAAPGTDVLNLWPDGSVRYLNGTSMATPQVSAALAIYWESLGNNLTVEQRVKKFLDTYTVNVPGLNNQCKDGRFLQMK